MQKQWINFHNHTIYSFLDGHGKPDAYAERAANLGMKYLATTDHGNVHSWPEFATACKKHGVKPIFGIEAYQARKTRFDKDPEERAGPAEFEWEQRGPYHLTVLARNREGFENVIKLSSRAYTEGFFVKPRLDFDLLAEHSGGLIVGSGCLNGVLQQALLREDPEAALAAAGKLQDIVGADNFFVELQDHHLEEQRKVKLGTIEIAKRLHAPIIPTGDCHYVSEDDHGAHDIMLCIGTGATVDQEKRFRFAGPHFYLQSYDEMARRFEPGWLQNSLVMAERVEDIELASKEFFFPPYPDLPQGVTAEQHLRDLTMSRLPERYENVTSRVIERANYELGVINEMGFATYFLVVAEIVNWAKSQGIRVGPSRGSAAGCIVSHALGITGLDPIEYDLLFERFLNPSRRSMPDIDIDFDDRYRNLVIDHIREKYGDDQVAYVCTFSTMGAKSCIRDASRALGYEFMVGGRLADMVPPPVFGKAKSLEDSMKQSEMIKAYEEDEDAHKILDAAKGLEGLVRQPGMHAAGVVVAPGPIINYIPVLKKTKKDGTPGPVITQWDKDWVEKLGLLKIDCLGLRNLSVIDICLKSIKQRHDLDLDIDAVPLDDDAVFAELRRGNSTGVFQLESAPMRELMRSLAPTTFHDIAALVALYRPGPMAANMHNDYADRKNGRKRVQYLHPDAEEALGDTYGLMIYQESLMRIAQQFAGFSLAEADNLRKACAKKIKEDMEKEEDKFLQGCKDTGYGIALGERWWSIIAPFADYAFPKAHAYGYGLIAYQTAYLKKHFTVEYMAALLTSAAGSETHMPLYLHECRQLGLQVLPPSINRSDSDFTVTSDTEILFGLSAIKGIGGSMLDNIFSSRTEPFTSLYDFERRAHPEMLKKNMLEHFTHSGSLDELVPEQPEQTMSRDEKMAILNLEHQSLGLYVSEHPLLGLSHLLEAQATHTITDLPDVHNGTTIVIAGVISGLEMRKTKRGALMMDLNIEDLTGNVNVLIFPKQTITWKDKLNIGDIVILTGRLEIEGEEDNTSVKIFFLDIAIPDLPQFGMGIPIVLYFDHQPQYSVCQRIEKIAKNNPGDSNVYLRWREGHSEITMRYKIGVSASIKQDLERLGQIANGSERLLGESS